jgi:endonuclease/exonuclease/phosphatase family metal-dependent hydrolase
MPRKTCWQQASSLKCWLRIDMKNRIWLVMVFFSIIAGCGRNSILDNHDDEPNINELSFGTDETLEIVTWNIQNFPKAGNETVTLVVDFIEQLDADIICLQEIEDNAKFILLNNELPGWDGFRTDSAAYSINLALLYKNTSDFQLLSIRELFTDDWYAFPRPPLQIEFLWNNEIFFVINNHLKASGGEENEERRRLACLALADYVISTLPQNNVIIAGDLNDLIIDPPANNVFQVFLQQPDDFLFADYDIAYGPPDQWSWNNGASHLDHIIISNELFSEFSNPGSLIKTIRIDEFMPGGWNDYDELISDHRPVALRLEF